MGARAGGGRTGLLAGARDGGRSTGRRRPANGAAAAAGTRGGARGGGGRSTSVAAAERDRGGGGTSVAAGARAWRWPEYELRTVAAGPRGGGGRSTSVAAGGTTTGRDDDERGGDERGGDGVLGRRRRQRERNGRVKLKARGSDPRVKKPYVRRLGTRPSDNRRLFSVIFDGRCWPSDIPLCPTVAYGAVGHNTTVGIL
jgi:hypothetical protein